MNKEVTYKVSGGFKSTVYILAKEDVHKSFSCRKEI